MSKEVQIIPENITLGKIDVIESSIKDVKKNEEVNFFMDIGHNVQYNLKAERIKIALMIDIKSENTKEVDNKDAGASFKFDFHFSIKDLNKYYDIEEDGQTPSFSELLISTLMGIGYSTTRGMIFDRLANTKIGSLVLPVINPAKILDSERRVED